MSQPTMPPLETRRLVVRPFTEGDLNDVYHIIDCDCFGQRQSDDGNARQRRRAWLEWNIAGQHQQAWLGHPPYGDRAMVRKSDGRMVGICGLVPSFGPFRRLLDGIDDCDSNSPEVGLFYAVSSDQRRQGYATEASRILTHFAFESLKTGRIVATTEADNEISIAVMQRLNFTIRRNTRRGWPQVVGFLTTSNRELGANKTTEGVSALSCRPATMSDVPLLARMNQQLIEDEASRNSMSLSELERRMKNWLDGDWQTVVIEQECEPVGYILFQFRSDEYRPSEATVYVRQFFIGRGHRSRGIGRQAFDIVAETYFPNVPSIVLEVLETNPRARQFWQSIEFRPYCTTLKLKPELARQV